MPSILRSCICDYLFCLSYSSYSDINMNRDPNGSNVLCIEDANHHIVSVDLVDWGLAGEVDVKHKHMTHALAVSLLYCYPPDPCRLTVPNPFSWELPMKHCRNCTRRICQCMLVGHRNRACMSEVASVISFSTLAHLFHSLCVGAGARACLSATAAAYSVTSYS